MQRGWRTALRVPGSDFVIAVVLMAAAVVTTAMDAAASHPAADLVSIVVAASLVLRTVATLAMTGIVAVGIVALSLLPGATTPLWAFAAALVVAFSIADQVTGTPAVVALALLLAAEYAIQVRTSSSTLEMLVTPLILVGAPALAGWQLGRSRRQAQRLHAMTHELETSRGEVASLAAEAERSRIARDLHDVLGHTLSSIAVQAGAIGEVLGSELPDPEVSIARAVPMVEKIRLAAGAGLDEVRRTLSMSTHHHESSIRQERLAELAEVDGAALTVRGEPRLLPPAVSTAIYGVAREALTNARRHAHGAPIGIDLEYAADTVTLTIANEGPVHAVQFAGQGLTGMRERVTALGGTIVAGPNDGGWRVLASIPLPQSRDRDQ